jgi:hypothetical protein
MKKRGWKSSDQLNRAKKELLRSGLVVVSRQGGRNKASLYALTWFPIHECKDKLDIQPTIRAPNNWKTSASSP